MEESSSVNKASRSSKKKDISEIERKVDKILFENKKRVTPEVKDREKQKQEYLKPTKLQLFDTKSFSLETRNKKPIYFVKLKEKPGEKKEFKKKDTTLIDNK